jgi:hypothetical protein
MQFYIPYYQRDYTWEKKHVLALMDDFKDAVHRAHTYPQKIANHYLSNFVLMSRKDNQNHTDLIDGQQRLTTIIMLLKAIALALQNTPKSSSVINDIDGLLWPFSNNQNFILMSPNAANGNVAYLDNLLNGKQPSAINATQRNIDSTFLYLKSLLSTDPVDLLALYSCILNSDVTIHVVSDIVEANRIFITLNARGKQLTYFEKIKGLLIYYAEKVGNQVLASDIHADFERISLAYEAIDNIRSAETPVIKLKADGPIDIDTLLGWHYCTIKQLEQIIPASTAYDEIEKNLKCLSIPLDWETFINQYRSSAVAFFENMHAVFDLINTDTKYYETIVMCRLTSIVWPLIVACNYRGFLNSNINVSNQRAITLFRLIQIIDKIHRVTKTPGQELIQLAWVTFNDQNKKDQDIADAIIEYHRSKWTRKSYSIPTKIVTEENDYFNYILFDFAVPVGGRSTVKNLRDFRKSGMRAAQVLRNYYGVLVRKDHNYNSNDKFSEGISSIGNYVLLKNAFIDTVDGVETKQGPMNPVELVNFAKSQRILLIADTANLFNAVTTIQSVDQTTIDARTNAIALYLQNEWEI